MKLFLNIKVRLTLWYLLILAILLLFFSFAAYFLLSNSLYGQIHDVSRLRTVSIESHLVEKAGNNESFSSESQDQVYQPLLVYRVDRDQLSKIESGEGSTIRINAPQGEFVIDQKLLFTPEIKDDQEVWLYYRPSRNEVDTYEILAIIRSTAEVRNTLETFKQVLLYVVPTTMFLAACLGFFLARKALKPVAVIARTAREIEEKDLSQKIPVQSKDELGSLATTLNQMLDRLKRAFDRERQFTADASHELRTPMAIIQGEATLALNKERSNEEYKKSLELISQKASHVSSVINKLLVLARADAGKERLNLSDVNLKELLNELALDVGLLCEEKEIRFQFDSQEDLIIKGDEIKLRELFLNLADNAIQYTPRGGSITISLVKRGSHACVSVKDTGIGISEEHLPHIFERFYRVDKAVSRNAGGAGLGLAICKQIAELHGGQIEVESKVGVGSNFSILLPIIKSNLPMNSIRSRPPE